MAGVKRIRIEITDYEDGMLVPGGVCGRILEYPGEYIAEALRWNEDEIDEFGSEVISGSIKVPSGITLASWLEMYYPEEGRVVRKGSKVRW